MTYGSSKCGTARHRVLFIMLNLYIFSPYTAKLAPNMLGETNDIWRLHKHTAVVFLDGDGNRGGPHTGLSGDLCTSGMFTHVSSEGSSAGWVTKAQRWEGFRFCEPALKGGLHKTKMSPCTIVP